MAFAALGFFLIGTLASALVFHSHRPSLWLGLFSQNLEFGYASWVMVCHQLLHATFVNVQNQLKNWTMAQLEWQTIKEYEEITFKQCNGVARIAFKSPRGTQCFYPKTVDELWEALILCHESQEIGVVLLTGEGPSPKDGGWAFVFK